MQSSVPESFQVEQSKRAGQMLRSQVMLEVSVRISVCAVGAAETSGVALASIVTSTLCTSAEIGMTELISLSCVQRYGPPALYAQSGNYGAPGPLP